MNGDLPRLLESLVGAIKGLVEKAGDCPESRVGYHAALNADAYMTRIETRERVPGLVANEVLMVLAGKSVSCVTILHTGSAGEITKALVATTCPAHADLLHSWLTSRPEFLQAMTPEAK